MPLLGMAVGAAMGALSGSLTDVGINNELIETVRSEITPGTSALFVISSEAVSCWGQAEEPQPAVRDWIERELGRAAAEDARPRGSSARR